MTTALEKPDMNTEELLAGQTITPAEEEQNSAFESRNYRLVEKTGRRFG